MLLARFFGLIDPTVAYAANFVAYACVFAVAAFLWTTFRLPLKASMPHFRRHRQHETSPTVRCPECRSTVTSL